MKCVVCHGEEINKKKIMEEIPMGKDIVFVPAEALVCNNCGERYYGHKTMKYLEEKEKELKRHKIQLKEIGKVKILAA